MFILTKTCTVLKNQICNMCSEITLLKSLPYLPGTNDVSLPALADKILETILSVYFIGHIIIASSASVEHID